MNKEDYVRYCPIRKTMCVGKKCIFAVKIDDPIRYPDVYHYVCGLVNVCNHGIPTYIDIEKRIDE